MPLSAKYITEHRSHVHTPESWGRAIIDLALQSALKQVGSGEKPSVEVEGKLTVSAVEALGCINVCGTYNGVTVCYHVNV